MTVNELIETLNDIEDKNKVIGYSVSGQFKTIDDMVGVNEYRDVVELQHIIVL